MVDPVTWLRGRLLRMIAGRDLSVAINVGVIGTLYCPHFAVVHGADVDTDGRSVGILVAPPNGGIIDCWVEGMPGHHDA